MKNLLLILCSILTISLTAQNQSFKGIIKDKNTQKPIPYCSVYFENAQIGTVTNAEGKFEIFTEEDMTDDLLEINAVGYKQQFVKVENLKSELFLETNDKLKAIKGDKPDINKLLIDAIFKIDDNYFNNAYESIGFLRSIGKRDSVFFEQTEAIVSIYQDKMNKPRQQFKYLEKRKIRNDSVSEFLTMALMPNFIYSMDIPNYNVINLINKRGLNLHTFELVGMVNIDGKPAYKIEFDQYDFVKKQGYKGYMLIDKISLAFVYFDYQISPSGLPYSRMRKGEVLSEKIQIRYRKIGDKYFLQYFKVNTEFWVKSKKRGYAFRILAESDFVVTQFKMKNAQPYPKEETIYRYNYDGYDIYKPTDNIENKTIILPQIPFEEMEKLIAPK